MSSFLLLQRLRVLQGGHVAYDQEFHDGVNIIRGENGSGKSTISDFIFFILGGQFDDWKDAASKCTQVQAEIKTPKGLLALKREVDTGLEPVFVFFGGLEDAQKAGPDGWERFPLHRGKTGKESFSQVLFRSLGIPETQSEGASNITIHQLLRLCYSDQRTPAPRLFRFEQFDTQAIREAVGDLLCGVKGYELFELTLQLREKDKEYGTLDTRLSNLIQGLRTDDALDTLETISARIKFLHSELGKLAAEIANVDDAVKPGEVKSFLTERSAARKIILEDRETIQRLESSIASLGYELREIEEFQKFLDSQRERLTLAEASFNKIGPMEFHHCPACGQTLDEPESAAHCKVCKNPRDLDDQAAFYNQIRLDLEIQSRETRQLISQKSEKLVYAKSSLRQRTTSHQQQLSAYDAKYSGSNGPREAYLAERTRLQGQYGAEIRYLSGNLELAKKIRELSEEKGRLGEQLDRMREREAALRAAAQKRQRVALSQISEIAASILRSDLNRQEEFVNADAVELNFKNDAILVGGTANFAESSNVVLKNSAILAMFLAAAENPMFQHPGFLLLDNIEDKGMTEDRSHNFQRLIVERVTEVKEPYQVIFTTSMMNPALELEDYVIGPAYTHENRALNVFTNGNPRSALLTNQ